MLRSAAKNHKDVAVVCDPADYAIVAEELRANGEVSYKTKYRLALKVFEHTAAYDAMISQYLREQIDAPLPDNVTLTFEKLQDLRYGENPHPERYMLQGDQTVQRLAGNSKAAPRQRTLRFNNINDANGALMTLKEFTEADSRSVKAC